MEMKIVPTPANQVMKNNLLKVSETLEGIITNVEETFDGMMKIDFTSYKGVNAYQNQLFVNKSDKINLITF